MYLFVLIHLDLSLKVSTHNYKSSGIHTFLRACVRVAISPVFTHLSFVFLSTTTNDNWIKSYMEAGTRYLKNSI